MEPISDERGSFARTWCRKEFAEQGISVEMVQANVSLTREAGSLRGLHFSWPPSQEAKLVRCGQGRVFDVALDLRPDSPSFLSHTSAVLDSAAGNALFIPAGLAHGFQTLEDDCEILYLMSDYFRPDLADGVRFDDPSFGIDWPLAVTTILDRDRTYPDFDRAEHVARYASLAGDPRPGTRSR
jgi:dTDP-4-dehydrorhamnose 3,5-epimerase